MRLESLQAAWPTLVEKPLFGWGLLSAAPILSGRLGHPTFVDNTYLTDLVELGLLGCAAFALLVLASLRRALFIPRTPIHLSRVFAVLSFLAMAGFVSILSITQGYAGFVILMALVSVEAKAGSPEAVAAEASPA
jgi:O-antigen ligase